MTAVAIRSPAAAFYAARRRFAWWLMVPALVLFAANAIFPLLYALDVSVRNYQLLIPVPKHYIGLANYARILSDPLFWSSVEVTLWFVAGVIFLQLPAALALALLFDRLPRWAGFAVTILLVPTIISPSVVGFQWAQIYNYQFGPLNYLLGLAHLGRPLWTASPQAALPSLIAIDFWEWTPFMVLLLFAGLRALPGDIIEAARIDGSSSLQVLRRIILPLLRPVIGIALVLRVLMSFKTFDTVYILTSGGPGTATENLAYYTYIQGFRYFNLGYASALAIIQLIVVAVLAKALIGLTNRPGLGA